MAMDTWEPGTVRVTVTLTWRGNGRKDTFTGIEVDITRVTPGAQIVAAALKLIPFSQCHPAGPADKFDYAGSVTGRVR